MTFTQEMDSRTSWNSWKRYLPLSSGACHNDDLENGEVRVAQTENEGECPPEVCGRGPKKRGEMKRNEASRVAWNREKEDHKSGP